MIMEPTVLPYNPSDISLREFVETIGVKPISYSHNIQGDDVVKYASPLVDGKEIYINLNKNRWGRTPADMNKNVYQLSAAIIGVDAIRGNDFWIMNYMTSVWEKMETQRQLKIKSQTVLDNDTAKSLKNVPLGNYIIASGGEKLDSKDSKTIYSLPSINRSVVVDEKTNMWAFNVENIKDIHFHGDINTLSSAILNLDNNRINPIAQLNLIAMHQSMYAAGNDMTLKTEDYNEVGKLKYGDNLKINVYKGGVDKFYMNANINGVSLGPQEISKAEATVLNNPNHPFKNAFAEQIVRNHYGNMISDISSVQLKDTMPSMKR